MKNKEGLSLKDMADYRFQCLNIVRDLTNTQMQCNGKPTGDVDYDDLVSNAQTLYDFVMGG